MAGFDMGNTLNKKGFHIAWILTLIWVALIAATWFGYRDSDGQGGGILNFIGRFHVLFVHLPIGIIFLALVMEVLACFSAFSHIKRTMPLVLWGAFLSGAAASLIGYILMSVEGFSGRALDLHLYFGLGVVVATVIALAACLKGKVALQRLAILAAVFSTAASGHFGGAMVHKADYLTEYAPEPLVPLLEVGLNAKPSGAETEDEIVADAESAEIPVGEKLVYEHFVAPIMAGKCNECHDANKTKGKLRLDTYELIMAGAEGTSYPTVIPEDSADSELLVRVLLPEDHDEFMPPKGDPLTAEEIQLLTLWIDAGAGPELTVADLGSDPSVESTALAVLTQLGGGEVDEMATQEVAATLSEWETLSPEEQQSRMDQVAASASQYHFSVMPISAEDERLRINVINAAKEFGDEQLAMLEPVFERVVWLDLGRSQVTDAGLESIGQMPNLQRLHLENTDVSDAGIAKLGSLSQLEYLNLYGTKVGNGIFDTFQNMPSLKNVYVWQTQVESSAARAYERSVNLEINTGIELAAVAPATPPEAEEDSAPTEKPEPKPAAKAQPKAAPKAEDKPAAKTAAKAQSKTEKQANAKPPVKPSAKPGNEKKPATPVADPKPADATPEKKAPEKKEA
ncbi:MAG: c-type cytochrome domain-containing protein [Verrucomicrobiota bacterium]